MRKLIMGCVVAATVAMSPVTEARPPATVTATAISTASSAPEDIEVGVASWYGQAFQGRPTASGEIYDMDRLTAAHRDLPLGTKVRVTNLSNGRSVALRINDRGPYISGRLIDVSKAAARKLGFVGAGLTEVQIEILSRPNIQTADLSSAPSHDGI